ncbi:hypothetical protein Tco_0825688 [Tanacetum coccineum]
MGTPTQVCVWSCPNFSAPAGTPFRCVKSKVCDWYWKRKDVTQGDWVEMDVVLNYVKLLTCKVLSRITVTVKYSVQTIQRLVAFHNEDLDAYDFDCDDVSNAKAVLMANLSSYGSYVLSEVPHSDSYHNDMDNQSVHAMQDFEQTPMFEFFLDNDDNMCIAISFRDSQYLQETLLTTVQDTNLYAQTSNQNPFYLKKAQRIKPTLYDGSVISDKHVASPVFDNEETLILEEVSRSKMLAKQNNPISKEKKINTTPINYDELNRLSEDFSKRFVSQKELSDEQAFWLQTSHPNTDQFASSLVKIEAPRELPKVSLVNTSLKKLKYLLGNWTWW